MYKNRNIKINVPVKMILFFVVLFAVSINFYKLNIVPPGVYVDEALTGYNAYSILLTKRDEYGKLLPLAFRFFGSYSPPIYVYLTSLVIKIFGFSVFSTRMLSATAGILGTVLVYYYTLQLKGTKYKYIPAISALLFAISPWNVFYSRTGYEIYFGFFLFSLGAYLLLRALEKPKLLIWGFIVMSLSTYGAHTEKFLVPIFLSLYLIIFRKEIFKKANINKFKLAAVFAFVVQIPNIYLLFTPSFFTKGNMFFSDVVAVQAEKISIYLPGFISKLLALSRELFSQYLTYFSPRSLFSLPDSDIQRSMPELSVFYSWMVVPYLVGLYFVFRNLKNINMKFLLFYLAICPLPVALVGDPFSTQRVLPLLMPMILVITIGLDRIIVKLRSTIRIPILVLLIGFSLILLWRSYFILLPKERAKVWGYGFSQLAGEIKSMPESTFVIDQSRIKPAYIELLFYLQYPPGKFHKQVDPTIRENYYSDTDFNQNYIFSNIETRNIIWEEDIYKDQILVGDEFAVSKDQAREHFLTKRFEIRSPIDEILFVGYKTNPTEKCLSDPNNIHCN